MPNSTLLYIAATTAVLSLAACSMRHKTQPTSSGRPYSVLLTGDTDSILYDILAASVPALPQPEPAFDVNCPKRLYDAAKYARSIVMVDIDPRQYTRTSVKYEKNVYAQPQMAIHVCTPSRKQLRADSTRLITVRDLLLRHETNAAILQLQRKHNKKAEEEVEKMFGVRMLIPADMTATKKGHDFIWISNNSPTSMRNICIYNSENRDSVMKRNIKGETDDMYMTTAPTGAVTTCIRLHGSNTAIRRGMWEMKGDAMGGPFISHTITDKKTGMKIVAETFVYAPGTSKRNILLDTEAALYTIRPANTHTNKKANK